MDLLKRVNYKVVLSVWTIIGLFTSGLFYLFRDDLPSHEDYTNKIWTYSVLHNGPVLKEEYFIDWIYFTLAGFVFIYVLGFLLSKRKKLSQEMPIVRVVSSFIKFLRKFSYQVYLVFWLGLGVFSTGFFYFNPYSLDSWKYVNDANRTESLFGNYVHVTDYYQNYLLVTVVGVILIGGLGYISSRKNRPTR